MLSRPAAALALLLAALPAAAQNAPKKLPDLAALIQQELMAKGETSVNLGAITGPDQSKNGGPGLGQKIKAELEKKNVAVKASGANLTFKAEFSQDEAEPQPGKKPLTALRIDGKLVDTKARGKTVKSFEIYLIDEQQIIETLGLSLEIPPTAEPGPNHARDKVIADNLDHPPKPKIDGGGAKSPQGTFGLEVLVGGQIRAAKEKDGTAFVEVKSGELYVVRLVNGAATDVAVDLSIDGINVFAFSKVRDEKDETQSKYKSYIVPKGKSIDIPGWHQDMTSAYKFEVGGYAESAAAKLAKAADSSDIGQITAVFRTAWPKGTQPPDGEGNAKDAEGNATKLGPPTVFHTKEVEMEFGNVRGSVSVRYAKPAQK